MPEWIEMHDDIPAGCLVAIVVGLSRLALLGLLVKGLSIII